MDAELQEVFNLAVSKGVNLFDTADSYGTGKLNGRSELLLGKFIREYPGTNPSTHRHQFIRKISLSSQYSPTLPVETCIGGVKRHLHIGELRVAMRELELALACQDKLILTRDSTDN